MCTVVYDELLEFKHEAQVWEEFKEAQNDNTSFLSGGPGEWPLLSKTREDQQNIQNW